MPGCSLCMGNQARVGDNTTVVSTSTRNFPNRLGKGANVFLASAELAAIASIAGELPTPAQYVGMCLTVFFSWSISLLCYRSAVQCCIWWAVRRSGCVCLSMGERGSPVELMLPYFVQLTIVLTFSRYLEEVSHIKGSDADTYRYLNFDKLPEYVEKAEQVCALPSMQTFDISHAESPCRIGLVPHRAILARLSLLHCKSEKLAFFC
jgi:hypothetical protein